MILFWLVIMALVTKKIASRSCTRAEECLLKFKWVKLGSVVLILILKVKGAGLKNECSVVFTKCSFVSLLSPLDGSFSVSVKGASKG